MGIVEPHTSSSMHKYNISVLLGFLLIALASARIMILDDGYQSPVGHIRVRRDDSIALTPEYAPAEYLRDRRDTRPYAPPSPVSYSAPHVKGRVGPVYTFVKTDPQANFKWGVRHRAGAQYGKRDASRPGVKDYDSSHVFLP